MIKLLIKHKIAETAINAFFNSVTKNFAKSKLLNNIQAGKHYKSIAIRTLLNETAHYDKYFDCQVITMDSEMDWVTLNCNSNYEHYEITDGIQTPTYIATIIKTPIGIEKSSILWIEE